MQNAAFAARALDWAYVALDVQPDRLADAVRGLTAGGFAGANVTTPHKVAVLELCDELDEVASRAKSVNTLVIIGGRIHGASTDAQALKGIDPQNAVVLGAGGAARAWRASLEQLGADVRTYARSGEWPPQTGDADLIVNATPVLDHGLVLDKAAIDADLRRRQQGYGRSPRQQIEQDAVEVLAGLRHGRTLGTPLALVVRNRDHRNWEWGMSPWPPEGEPSGKGTKPVTLPRPGHADLAGALKYGLADVRDALERASARQTAVLVAAGAVAKSLLAEVRVFVRGFVQDEAKLQQRIDEARAERDTVGGVVEVRAQGVPPGLGSYASRGGRLAGRI